MGNTHARFYSGDRLGFASSEATALASELLLHIYR